MQHPLRIKWPFTSFLGTRRGRNSLRSICRGIVYRHFVPSLSLFSSIILKGLHKPVYLTVYLFKTVSEPLPWGDPLMQLWLYKLTTRKLSSLPRSWSASGNFIDSVKQYFQEYNKTSIRNERFKILVNESMTLVGLHLMTSCHLRCSYLRNQLETKPVYKMINQTAASWTHPWHFYNLTWTKNALCRSLLPSKTRTRERSSTLVT